MSTRGPSQAYIGPGSPVWTGRVVRCGVAEPVELIACPTCGAAADQPCAVGWGKRLAVLPHPKRRALANNREQGR